MSWFLPLFFGYQLMNLLRSGDRWTWAFWTWKILQITADEIVLVITVLCHEFGHGNMARYLGGQIDHILLWVFGGICFSTRVPSTDTRKILKDELLVVSAGPATHFFQAPFWGLIMWALFAMFTAGGAPGGSAIYLIGYESPWRAFVAALTPLSPFNYDTLYINGWRWAALLWYIVGRAVQLNVLLFLFNVFVPMYPMDGSKLLVCSLMYCGGLPARRAAYVLLGITVPLASLMILGALYLVFGGAVSGGTRGFGEASASYGLMGFMALMSLAEAYRIHNLLKERRLHTHPVFQTARTWGRTERDAFGVVHRINNSDLDDDTPPFGSSMGNGCCLYQLCPCFRPGQRWVGQSASAPIAEPGNVASAAAVRAQRSAMLIQVDGDRETRHASVRQLQEQRFGTGAV